MGVPAKCDAQIVFKGKAPESFKDDETLQKTLMDFYGEPCGVEVYDMKHYKLGRVRELAGDDDAVTFELYSERYQNLYWQQDLLIKYLKEHCQVEEISTSVWMSDESGVYLTGEDLEEYQAEYDD